MSVDTADTQPALYGDDISSAMPSDYIALMKPRVMRLVVFTALCGMLAAPGSIDPVLSIIAIICIAVGAGASGALNMWYDADIDAIMSRTTKRPIPAGNVTPEEARNFGLILSIISVLVLGMLVNWISAAILAFTIFFYAVIYTMWLKRSTPQNIVIGGAAGAFPPMLGWATVSGDLAWGGVVLFAIIFIWTPPHFWALALWKMRDYDDAHVPMMPNAVGEASTRNQMLAYSAVLLPITILPAVMGFAGIAFGVVAVGLSGYFLWLTYKVWKIAGADEKLRAEKHLFGYSIAYLFALFAALAVDAIVWRATGDYILGTLI
ncbi:heme o synthase [Ahrensia sp. R2A130]|uniref:heme o synthase n=1 Tax=Ahrensia sp. R2A130 TaxID=744979 RepID=UPI0001E0D862|nr:protoheme IX farnesyltransferase [Ahrensia sp. R2A130]